MQNVNPLDGVISYITAKKLFAGIQSLENYLLSYPQMPGLDKLSAIKVDYELMADYWKRGANDPEREQVYEQLLRRLYVLAMNIRAHHLYRTNSYWITTYQRPRKNRTEWGLTGIREELENYVTETAMLDFEPAHIRANKSLQLNQRHQTFMSNLFEYVLTSRQWKDSLSDQFVDILLSPTIDTVDQQLLVSAITLAALNAFDVNKVLTLIKVYKQSTDICVRQRALVGWTLTVNAEKSTLYPEIKQTIAEIGADETMCQELTELQMQLFFCKSTESDQKKIQDEIMPDIMNGGHFKMTSKGLEEMDEDALEDILHPDAAERDMEKMEQSVTRMTDMQKEGSDIYFAGFAQMKRFSFFYDLSNWFVPFFANHPAVNNIWENSKGQKFLHSIISRGAFCDSDKYSFVLSFDQVLNRLPAHILNMMEEGEAMAMPLGGIVTNEERKTPAYIRRMYLQDLYRFFRLYPARQEFRNPFDEEKIYLFFASELLCKTSLVNRMSEVVNFLVKRKYYHEAEEILCLYPKDKRDYQYCFLRGHLCQVQPEGLGGEDKFWYKAALKLKPDDKKALAGLARAHFYDNEYRQALDVYKQLLDINAESRSYMLNASICMANLRQCEDALKLLYKLNYLDEENMEVVLVLAWVLTIDGRFDEAKKYFAQLMTQEHPQADCFLYQGYCLWFSGDIGGAIQSFRRYQDLLIASDPSLENAFYLTENDVIRKYHIGKGEIQMMLDAIKG